MITGYDEHDAPPVPIFECTVCGIQEGSAFLRPDDPCPRADLEACDGTLVLAEVPR